MSFFSNSNTEARSIGVDMNAVMRQVYLWMTLGLVVSAVTAYGMASSGLTLRFVTSPILPLITVVAYLILAFALQPIIMRSQPSTGAFFYLLFTGLFGITISSIFLIYRIQTIAYAFVATSATFATMSVVGYTTKIDLSRMGSILMMACLGLFIATIVNLFLASSALYWMINYAGVLIFVGLTAYDTQWIKNYAAQVAQSGDSNMIARISLMGAFHLYLDFVNLFMFILRILGSGGGGDRRR
jgi:uncharacterized protein